MHNKKNNPCSPAPCPSRQPQLQTQLLFSMQTTGYLGCQLCLVVKLSPRVCAPLVQSSFLNSFFSISKFIWPVTLLHGLFVFFPLTSPIHTVLICCPVPLCCVKLLFVALYEGACYACCIWIHLDTKKSPSSSTAAVWEPHSHSFSAMYLFLFLPQWAYRQMGSFPRHLDNVSKTVKVDSLEKCIYCLSLLCFLCLSSFSTVLFYMLLMNKLDSKYC